MSDIALRPFMSWQRASRPANWMSKHSRPPVLPTLELRKELLKIRGVGPYAAANLLMILGRSDFIPIDTYALKMVSHEWHKGRPITSAEVEKAFTKWGEYKGLAFWFWDWKYNGG